MIWGAGAESWKGLPAGCRDLLGATSPSCLGVCVTFKPQGLPLPPESVTQDIWELLAASLKMLPG